MNHVYDLFLWWFSQRAVMLLLFVPFAALVVVGSLMIITKRG